MKKFLMMILFLSILLIPLNVYAETVNKISYKAIVSNSLGAKYYIINDTIIQEEPKLTGTYENGTELNIDYEIEYNGEIYACIFESYVKITLVNIKDLIMLDDNVSFNNSIEETKKIKIVNNDGEKMYKQPSCLSDILYTIPYDTDLIEEEYIIGGETNMVWSHVKYNGEEGWIYNFNLEDIAYYLPNTSDKIITIKDTDITNKGEKVGTIPGYTEISNYLFSNNIFQAYGYDKLYITYDGISGFIDCNSCAFSISGEATIKENPEYMRKLYKDVYMYEDAKNEVIVQDIPVGTKLKCSYYITYIYGMSDVDICSIYTNYNGKNGWVLVEYDDINIGQSNLSDLDNLENTMSGEQVINSENQIINSGDNLETTDSIENNSAYIFYTMDALLVIFFIVLFYIIKKIKTNF